MWVKSFKTYPPGPPTSNNYPTGVATNPRINPKLLNDQKPYASMMTCSLNFIRSWLQSFFLCTLTCFGWSLYRTFSQMELQPQCIKFLQEILHMVTCYTLKKILCEVRKSFCSFCNKNGLTVEAIFCLHRHVINYSLQVRAHEGGTMKSLSLVKPSSSLGSMVWYLIKPKLELSLLIKLSLACFI